MSNGRDIQEDMLSLFALLLELELNPPSGEGELTNTAKEWLEHVDGDAARAVLDEVRRLQSVEVVARTMVATASASMELHTKALDELHVWGRPTVSIGGLEVIP